MKSSLGYKDNSPYRYNPFNIINTPKGLITMDGVSTPLIAFSELGERKYLPPNSGLHKFKGKKILEIPVMQDGGNADFNRLLQQFGLTPVSTRVPSDNTTQVIRTPSGTKVLATPSTPVLTTEQHNENVRRKKEADAREIQRRKDNIARSNSSKGFMEGARNSAVGDKMRFFPNDPNSFIDEYINPLKWIGDMSDNLGHTIGNPNSTVGDYAIAVGTPLAGGLVGRFGAKNTAQWANNLVNPLAGIPIVSRARQTPFFNLSASLIKDKQFKNFGKLAGFTALAEVAPIVSKIPGLKKIYKDQAFKYATASGGAPSLDFSNLDYIKRHGAGIFSQYTGNHTNLFAPGEVIDPNYRNLLREYIYGDSPGFKPSLEPTRGLEKYHKRYGDMKVYTMNSAIGDGNPVDLAMLKDRLKGLGIPTPKKGEKSKTILFSNTPGFENPIKPLDNVAGHSGWIENINGTPELVSQDIWKFTPKEYVERWGSRNRKPRLDNYLLYKQAILMDNAGKPFITMSRNPLEGYRNGGYKRQFQNGVVNFTDEDIEQRRNRVVEEADRVVTNKDWWDLPADFISQNPDAKGMTCIGGVCYVLNKAGVLKELNPSMYKNTEFERNASSYRLSKPLYGLKNLKKGDIIQHRQTANNSGRYYPSHGQIFTGRIVDGKYQFFDNYNKEYKRYTPEYLEEILSPSIGEKRDRPSAQIISLDPRPRPSGLTEEQKREIGNDMAVSRSTGSYSVNNPDINDMQKTLLGLMNDNSFDTDLQKVLRVSAQDLERMKPLVYGMFGQESNFGDPESLKGSLKYGIENTPYLNVAASTGKTFLHNLANPFNNRQNYATSQSDLSLGPAQIKYKYIPQDVKDYFNINSPEDLKDTQKAYIAALSSLQEARNIVDNYVSNGTRPELADVDEYERALYWINSPGKISNPGATQKDYANYFDAKQGAEDILEIQDGNYIIKRNPFANEKFATDWADKNLLRLDKGSYPWKVLHAARDLNQNLHLDEEKTLPNMTVKATKKPFTNNVPLNNNSLRSYLNVMGSPLSYRYEPQGNLGYYQDGGSTPCFKCGGLKKYQEGEEFMSPEITSVLTPPKQLNFGLGYSNPNFNVNAFYSALAGNNLYNQNYGLNLRTGSEENPVFNISGNYTPENRRLSVNSKYNFNISPRTNIGLSGNITSAVGSPVNYQTNIEINRKLKNNGKLRFNAGYGTSGVGTVGAQTVLKSGGSLPRYQVAGVYPECPSGYIWNDTLRTCVKEESSVFGPNKRIFGYGQLPTHSPENVDPIGSQDSQDLTNSVDYQQYDQNYQNQTAKLTTPYQAPPKQQVDFDFTKTLIGANLGLRAWSSNMEHNRQKEAIFNNYQDANFNPTFSRAFNDYGQNGLGLAKKGGFYFRPKNKFQDGGEFDPYEFLFGDDDVEQERLVKSEIEEKSSELEERELELQRQQEELEEAQNYALAMEQPDYGSSRTGSQGTYTPKADILELTDIASKTYGVPKDLLLSQQFAESSGNPNAVSSKGAFGLTQFMPKTAEAYGVKKGDVASQINGQAAYMRDLYDQFGSWDLAIMAYNAGPGNVKNGKAFKFKETKDYLQKVKNTNVTYEQGGEYDLSISEINDLIARGYKIKTL